MKPPAGRRRSQALRLQQRFATGTYFLAPRGGPVSVWAVRRALREARRSRGGSVEVVERLVEVDGRSVDLDARLDKAAGSLDPGFVYLRLDPSPPNNRRVPRRGTAAALDPAAAIPIQLSMNRPARRLQPPGPTGSRTDRPPPTYTDLRARPSPSDTEDRGGPARLSRSLKIGK